MNKRGIALVITFVVIMVLTILGSALVTRSISESRVSQKYLQISQAFWLAEAGVNQALNDLRSNFSTTTIGPTARSVRFLPRGMCLLQGRILPLALSLRS
jgi:Tfp pilus assembly protein PilX